MQIVLLGKIPAKKNNRRIFRDKSGRMRNLPSEEHEEWFENVGKELLVQKIQFEHYEEADIRIDFYNQDSGRWDMSNRAESIMDMLVAYEFIEDDSRKYVRRLSMECHPGNNKNMDIKTVVNITRYQKKIP